MRFSSFLSASFLLSLFSAIGSPALGCSCVQPPPGTNTAQQLAEWAANGKEAIFEGKVEAVELRWKFVEARIGDLVPADIEQEPPSNPAF
jgi:hypothetical protein